MPAASRSVSRDFLVCTEIVVPTVRGVVASDLQCVSYAVCAIAHANVAAPSGRAGSLMGLWQPSFAAGQDNPLHTYGQACFAIFRVGALPVFARAYPHIVLGMVQANRLKQVCGNDISRNVTATMVGNYAQFRLAFSVFLHISGKGIGEPMAGALVTLDTTKYERRAVSAFIYEPVLYDDGRPVDFRTVYGSEEFVKDWQRLYHNTDCINKLLRKDALVAADALHMMEKFLTEPPYPFVCYVPMADLHVFFEPIPDLPNPYAGFYITSIANYASQERRDHFLQNIKQIKNKAVLFAWQGDDHLEPIFLTDDFAKMMECTPAEGMTLMRGHGFYQTTDKADRPLVRSMIHNHVADDGSSILTIRKITAKGHSIWCNVNYAFINDFDQQYLYCTYTDVTELKAYEERLRGIYMSYGHIFYREDKSTLVLMRADLTQDSIEEVTGRDRYDSDSTGYGYTDALRRRAEHLPILSERSQFLELFDKKQLCASYLEGKNRVSQIVFSIRRDGRICFVEFSVSIARHPLNSNIIAFVTEKECNNAKVEETLTSKILSKQFDMVAYLADGQYGVTIGEAEKVHHGSIFPVRRVGDYRQYLMEQVYPVLSGDEEDKAATVDSLSLEAVGEHLKINEPYVVDISIEIDGHTYYKQFDFYSIDPQANFYILLKSDTTEIQQQHIAMNEQLNTALEAANQANVAKTAFLSSMSHEIRTPMNAIIGLDSIALKDPGLSERTRDHLEKIGRSARHLLGLINDILDMSRIESGRMIIKSEEFSFSDMLEQINIMASSQCQERGLSYECHVVGGVCDYYIGDAMKLKQVLINILGNAVKFTQPPGTVSFYVERIAEFEKQSTLQFTIKDTGIGMEKSYLPKLFVAFSQENEDNANKYGSTGLGMAITKNIVELMNGNISVESEKGVGTIFTVSVTLKDSDRRSSFVKDVRPQDLNVLIVDDDPEACEHARIVLEEIGIVPDIALSGKEALKTIRLKAARREGYNLIFVDWKMPEQNGVEVVAEIRKCIGFDSAIVILTAYSWDDIEDGAKHAGVDSFMAKPLSASNILSTFRQIMEKKQTAEEKRDPTDLNGRRILLAEDMLINAEIMKEILGMMGIEADHAENGQIAVDMFTAAEPGTYDAILMDVRMPVMDGLQATRAIRAIPRPDAKNIPIVAMTANAFDEDVQRSLQAGMNAHLSKPVESDRLFTTLGELIRD